MLANLFSAGVKGTLADMALLMGVIVTSGGILARIVRGPVARWLADVLRQMLVPMQNEVEELNRTMDAARTADRERWVQHDAHHLVSEAKVDGRLHGMNDRIRTMEKIR